MLRNKLFISGLILSSTAISSFYEKEKQPEEDKLNILFIAVDDMNNWTTVFDKSNPIKTPNIEKLAERGAFFTHAYSPSSACNPSRAAVLTGKRPHNTGIYGNRSDWRGTLSNRKTLQKYFKDQGYFVGGSGKIFHHHSDWAFHDNASFHEFLMMSINEPYPDEKLNGLDWYGSRNTDWGIWPEDIRKTPDYRTAEYAINFLEKKHDKPFLLNVGIYKPHSPWFAPEEFFDLYPLSTLESPILKENPRDDLPSGALTLTKNTRWFWEGMLKAKKENSAAYKEFLQAYYACSSFADAMVGKIIEALDKSPYRNNTIIVLWSDHGFHIGEKEHIEKFALWEKTTHVPYIIVAPGTTTPGQIIDNPVDLMTIYPTLVELCGFDIPDDLDGYSLVPLLKDSTIQTPPALMTYMRRNHAIRNERWRYIQYADGTEELYDHYNDPLEWYNLSEVDDYKVVIEEMKTFVPKVNADQVENLPR